MQPHRPPQTAGSSARQDARWAWLGLRTIAMGRSVLIAIVKSAALIVIDMLNRYEHEDADALIPSVREMLPVMQALIGLARDNDVGDAHELFAHR